MDKNGVIKRSLIISTGVVFLFFCLLFLTANITGQTILSKDIVFYGYGEFFLFGVLIFISSFLILQLSGTDSLQKRLGEMENSAPSSDVSRNSKRGLFQRIRDKYSFRRSVSQVKQDGEKYAGNSDYLGGDSRLKDYFDRATLKNYYRDDNEKRENFANFYAGFMKDLNQNFPSAERENILNQLKNIENPILEKPTKLASKFGKFGKSIKGEHGELRPEGMIAVHKTNYLPNQQQIKTTANARYNSSDFNSGDFANNHAAATRQTVHFSLNGPVSSHMSGNWDRSKYAILVPLDKIFDDKIVALRGEDSYSYGNVPLNRGGTEVVISKDAYLSMSPKEINRLKSRTGAEIITIQSGKDSTLNDTINRRIKERGYGLFRIGKDYAEDPDSQNGIHIDPQNKSGARHIFSPFSGLEKTVNGFVNDSSSGRIVPIENQYNQGDVDLAEEYLKQIEGLVKKSRKGVLTRSDIASLDRQRKVVESRHPVQPYELSNYKLTELLDLYRTDSEEGKDIDSSVKKYQLSETRKGVERDVERSKKSRLKLPK